MKQVEKKYYKPHFGPEATDKQLDDEDLRVTRQKQYVNYHLKDQMDTKYFMNQNNLHDERAGDIENLRAHHALFSAEERAKDAKLVFEK